VLDVGGGRAMLGPTRRGSVSERAADGWPRALLVARQTTQPTIDQERCGRRTRARWP